jgi:hypothetical protein
MEDSIAVFDLVANNEILPAMVAVATVFAFPAMRPVPFSERYLFPAM